jgi:diguanylate cyclase (GGDEF)-like protein
VLETAGWCRLSLLHEALRSAARAVAAGQLEAWDTAGRLAERLQAEARRREDARLSSCAKALERSRGFARRAALNATLAELDRRTPRRRPTVLLVDDDPDVRALVAAMLPTGWRLTVAECLAEARDRLGAQPPPSVVLLDLGLPDGDGRQLLSHPPVDPCPPVVVLSGREDGVSFKECLALGAEAYLAKPVQGHALAGVLHRALAHRGEQLSAAKDPLTGLGTRDSLTRAYRAAARAAGPGKPLSVAILDLDRFKQVNDRHGHLAGDALLQRFAQVLRAETRGSDGAYRWGGDEFVLVLPETRRPDAWSLLRRVREELALAPLRLSAGPTLQIRFSAGVTEVRGEEQLAEALERADAALYWAKHLLRPQPATPAGQPALSLSCPARAPHRGQGDCGLAPGLQERSA